MVTPPDVSLRRAAWVMLFAAAWSAFVWGNRVLILLRDDRSLGFLVVHYVIAAISLAVAVALAWYGWMLRHRTRA
ncbi:MAG: hypothetical protein PVI35_00480 [Acidimicrobiia bacterium]|jgi:hypothetical protein